jgi:hypothetical protein
VRMHKKGKVKLHHSLDNEVTWITKQRQIKTMAQVKAKIHLCYHWGRHVHRFTVWLTLPSKNRCCHFHLLGGCVLQACMPTIKWINIV